MSLTPHRFYNCEKFSDVKVNLRDGGFIYCHRVVLSQASDVLDRMLSNGMAESSSNILHFPEYEDVIVEKTIHLIYCTTLSCPITITQRTTEQWCDILEFANYLNATIVVGALVQSIPSDITIDRTLSLSMVFRIPQLINRVSDILFTGIVNSDLNVTDKIFNSGLDQDPDQDPQLIPLQQFALIHEQWSLQKPTWSVHFKIFLVTHHYFYLAQDKTPFEHFIAETKFDAFCQQDLRKCIELPLIKGTLTERMLQQISALLPQTPFFSSGTLVDMILAHYK